MLAPLGSHFGEHSLRMVFRFHHRRGVVSGAGTQAGREAGVGRVRRDMGRRKDSHDPSPQLSLGCLSTTESAVVCLVSDQRWGDGNHYRGDSKEESNSGREQNFPTMRLLQERCLLPGCQLQERKGGSLSAFLALPQLFIIS